MGRIRLVEYQGEWMPVAHAAARAGMSYSALYTRVVDKGMTVEEAIADGRRTVKTYCVGGEQLTIDQMSQRSGVAPTTLWDRLRRGETPERAMMTAEQRGKGKRCHEIERKTWPEAAFGLIYPACEMAGMRFGERSPGNWGWQSEYFLYMASLLQTEAKRYVMLRAWWRDSREPALMRLYALKKDSKKNDTLAEIADARLRERILRSVGLE